MFFCCFSQTPSSKASQYEADDTGAAAEDAHIDAHPSIIPAIKEPRQLPGLGAGGEYRCVPARCDTAAKQQHAQQPKADKDSCALGLPKPQWRGEGRNHMYDSAGGSHALM